MKKPHNHIGNKNNYTWNTTECIAEVMSYPDQHKINYSMLARKYQLQNSSGKMSLHIIAKHSNLLLKITLKFCSISALQFMVKLQHSSGISTFLQSTAKLGRFGEMRLLVKSTMQH